MRHQEIVKERERAATEQNQTMNNATRERAYASGGPWSQEDIARILAPDRPSDAELAEELGRSMYAVWQARFRYTKGEPRALAAEKQERASRARRGN
jgi:hypothetical protein